MKPRVIIYSLLWLIFIAYCYVAYPHLNHNVMFPIGILVGIGGWLFNRTTALLICLAGLIHHFIHYQHFADTYIIYQNRANATLSNLIVTILIGSMCSTLRSMRDLHVRLDNLVDKRNQELKALTQKLLNYSENLKIKNGQHLHDGIGQQLTGVQLLCNPLSEALRQENNPYAPMADQLGRRSSELHNHFRRISRLLFPVRIQEVGLDSSLQELAACIQDIKSAKIALVNIEELSPMTAALSLQAYRICQETCLHAIEELHAKEISITAEESILAYIFRIEHNGRPLNYKERSDSFGLIKYRLQQVAGSLDINENINGNSFTRYTIPKQAI